jgi:hypothetical protein
VLPDGLAELCNVGLATRTVDDGPSISIAYEFTDAGRPLLRALAQITRWTEEQLPADEWHTTDGAALAGLSFRGQTSDVHLPLFRKPDEVDAGERVTDSLQLAPVARSPRSIAGR